MAAITDRRNFESLALLVLLVMGCIASAPAQEVTGSITGYVTDQSGAAVPAAEVIAKNTETGVSYRADSGGLGIYTVSLLPPGHYDLTVSKAGFDKAVVAGIEVNVEVVVKHDVTLQAGKVTQTVEVKASANTVETERPTLGLIVQSNEIMALPSGSRTYLGLATTTAGVFPAPSTNGMAPYARRDDYQISIAGVRFIATNYVYDGIPSKDPIVGTNVVVPPMDSIAEFKVEMGYFTGNTSNPAVVEVITKQGTNKIHGSLWDFHQNYVLDAAGFNSLGLKEFSLQNIFGYQVGGPVIKNKLFAYSAYEGVRSIANGTGQTVMPNPAFKTGDFSSLLPNVQLVDPLTGQPFVNNQIPTARLDPLALTAIASGFIPDPNIPGAAPNSPNYFGATHSPRTDDRYVERGDYAMSDADRIFARWIRTNSLVTQGAIITNGVGYPLNGDNVALNWVHIISPVMTLNLKAGMDRVYYSCGGVSLDRAPGGKLWPQVFGFKNLNTESSCDSPPNFFVTNYNNFGGGRGCANAWRQDMPVILDMAKLSGRHQLEWGGEYIRKWQKYLSATAQDASMFYSNAYSGDNFADFMLGAATQEQGGTATLPGYRISSWWDGFVQDTFKATKSLSLTFGLRYQVYPWPYEIRNQGYLFNPLGTYASQGACPTIPPSSVAACNLGGYTFASPSQRRVINTNWHDFAPRLGFAWAPGGRKDFVVRSSYGIFYEEIPGDDGTWDLYGPNRSFLQNFEGGIGQPLSTANLFPDLPTSNPNLVRGPGVGVIAFDNPNRPDSYEQIWTLSLQKTLPWNLQAELSYVGSHGVHLSKRIDINRPDVGNPPTCDSDCVQAHKPYPDFGFLLVNEPIGQSWYDGLQFNLRKPLSNHVFLQQAFTWSKSLDTCSYDALAARNYRPLDRDKARSTFDIRLRDATSLVYNMPTLNDKSFAVRHVLGAWQASLITTLESGESYSVYSADNSNTGVPFDYYPNLVAVGNLPPSQRTAARWFNTSAFVLPPVGYYGNAGADILDGPGNATVNFALMKNFPFHSRLLGEGSRFEFRSEAYNLFNRSNLLTPDDYLGDPTFGQVLGAGPARTIQFALKLIF